MGTQKSWNRYRLACCAMPKKLQSVPMKTIFETLQTVGNFELVPITGALLLESEPSEWPVVDCLIAFYSKGYPLAKVLEYVKLVRPVVLNDVEMQYILRRRDKVYEYLIKGKIPIPLNFVVDHAVDEIEEFEDYIVCKGVKLNKPFIEKPVDADDHNNFVYYPTNAGGGCKKLFRKLADRSSEYYPNISKIRRDGVYVYEEFVPTQGTDIKVYTVGTSYAHAEARKSPTLDGRVQRTILGKEERYPVMLSNDEKWIAYRVVQIFKQTVCGFDILRCTSGKAVVCDVNGWSFVKGNSKYYEDCANLISSLFYHALRNRRVGPKFVSHRTHSQTLMEHKDLTHQDSDEPTACNKAALSKRLSDSVCCTPANTKCLDPENNRHAAVHQKCIDDVLTDENLNLTMTPENRAIENTPAGCKSITLDDTLSFDSVLDRCDQIGRCDREFPFCVLDEISQEDLASMGVISGINQNKEDLEDQGAGDERSSEGIIDNDYGSTMNPMNVPNNNSSASTLGANDSLGELQTIIVVMRHGDRSPKQKLKFVSSAQLVWDFFHQRRTNSRNKAVKLKSKQELLFFQQLAEEVQSCDISETERAGFARCASLLNTDDVEITRKVQLVEQGPEQGVLVIVKWGGDLTKKGLETAEQLGHHLRESLYPGEKDGLLRLHSTFRHDFKMYTSDEGRCQLTAAAFTKGFLDLDGDLTPILVQMVCRDQGGQDLFLEGEYTQTVKSCKQILQEIVNSDVEPHVICQQYFQPRFHLVKCPICCPDSAYTLAQPVTEGACETESAVLQRRLTGDINETDEAFDPADEPTLTPAAVAVWQSLLKSYHETVDRIGSFKKRLLKVNAAIEELIEMIERCLADVAVLPEDVMSAELRRTNKKLTSIKTRWTLLRNCWFKDGVFDATKIPEVYDNARYDAVHSHTYIHYADAHTVIFRVFDLTQTVGPLVSAMEFGITPDDRVEIGKKTVPALLKKIYDDIIYQHARNGANSADSDLTNKGLAKKEEEEEHIKLQTAEARRMGIKSPWRKVRSRYYAASASHVLSLLNVLTYGQFVSQSRYHSRNSSDNTTTSAVASNEFGSESAAGTGCQNIPPLYITAGDAPYLSHISIRMWRGTRSVGLRDFAVELCWHAEEVKNSIRCTAADLANVLKHGFSKKLSPTSPPIATKTPTAAVAAAASSS